MNCRFKSLATLGDSTLNSLTASFYIAEKKTLAHEIIGFESYEAAIEAVKTDKAEVALVGGAYPKIANFIMNPDITCIDAFVEQIPPLVVAGVQSSAPTHVDTVYLQPATLALLAEVTTRHTQTVEVKATSAAAAKAKADPQSIAICSEPAADYYVLNIYQILRPALHMPFHYCYTAWLY